MAKRNKNEPPRLVVASKDREAILRKWWETDKPVSEIVDLCNELPGSVVNKKNISRYAGDLDLRHRNVQQSIKTPAPLGEIPCGTNVSSEKIQLEDALAWGERVRINMTGNNELDVAAINAARAAYGLPTYEVIRMQPIESRRFKRVYRPVFASSP